MSSENAANKTWANWLLLISCGVGSLLFLLALLQYPQEGLYYQSNAKVFGVPLLDVRLPPQRPPRSMPLASQLDYTLARGIVAIGPVAVGGIAIGGGAVGLMAFGLLSVAGYASVGVCAVALRYAVGVLALARRTCSPRRSKTPTDAASASS